MRQHQDLPGAAREAVGLFQTSTDAVLALDWRDQTVLALNPRAEVILGPGAVGRKAGELCTALRPGADGRLAAGLLAGRPEPATVAGPRGNPTTYEVVLTGVEVPAGTFQLAVFRDLGVRGKVLETLRQSEAQLRAAGEALGEGLVMTDREDRVLLLNRTLAELLGRPAASLSGLPVSEVLELAEPGPGAPERVSVAGFSGRYEARLRCSSGRTPWVEINAATRRDERGSVVGGIATVLDITDRKHVQEELMAAIDAAEDATRAKSAFLANMSHELRTPLNAIIGYSEMLEEELRERGLQDLLADLEKVHGAGKHLLDLIEDILDLSRIEAGRIELRLGTFDVANLVHEVADSVRPLARQRRNALEVVCPPDIGGMRADQVRLRQVLLKLLSNASKFTEDGTIHLEVAPLVLNGAPWISFRVRDSGIGMSAEQLSGLFRAFTQADVSATRRYGGTGLGLAIGRQLCQLMGGDINVESQPDSGSAFTVRLPVNASEAVVTEDSEQPPSGEDGAERPWAVVIDDDRLVRALLQRFLVREGYRVALAATGEEGLRRVREMRPSLVTLDVVMPGMDGWNVLRTLKADPDLNDTPVVLITIVDNRPLGMELGAAGYVTKPVDWRELGAVVHKQRSGPLVH